MPYPVDKIANKLISLTNREQGDTITNLKLQKLLYYVQGFNLAAFGQPLFEEEIEAWQYGPVVPSVYARYAQFKANPLESTDDEILELEPEEEALFQEVYEAYSAYSAIGLMKMTHEEAPWKNTPTAQGSIISKEQLEKFFKTKLD
jgi:hypothetical protein